MAYQTKVFNDKEVLTHHHMNNIIAGIDELKANQNNNSASSQITLEQILKVAELPKQQKVDLFVFGGQSNMMGAAHLPPEDNPVTYYAFEYKYQPILKGEEKGEFIYAQNPAGDWHYIDTEKAYGSAYLDTATGKSKLNNYSTETYFVPACRDKESGFGGQSEFKHYPAATMAPYFARYYAQLGNPCIYAHMAKGSCKILNYFTADAMEEYNKLITEYNSANGKSHKTLTSSDLTGGGDAFDAKYQAMLKDYAELEPNNTIVNKCFFWLQGESDTHVWAEYRYKLQALWKHLQSIGFTHFFILRVGFWGSTALINEIKAQTDFCNDNENCYIITRAPSLIPHPSANTNNWWVTTPSSEYDNCRDSYLASTSNHHFNEKAHKIFAKRSADNVNRVLHLGLEPILEEENIKDMVGYGTYLFSITANPSDAIIKINGIEQSSTYVTPNSSVSWEVSKSGYITQSGTETITKVTTKSVILEEEDNSIVTTYKGEKDFTVTGLRIELKDDVWTESINGTSSVGTDYIAVTSNQKVWLEYVWRWWSQLKISCIGLYDANKNLVSAITYEDFGIDTEGATGGTSAFDTPYMENAVLISDIEARDNVSIAYVRFCAWEASAGGKENTTAKIITPEE